MRKLKHCCTRYCLFFCAVYISIQSKSAILNTFYLELLLSQTFYLVALAFSNFHFVEQFSRFLQLLFGCLPSGISNIQMKFFPMSHTLHFRNSTVNNLLTKLLTKYLGEKCQALRDLEKGLSNKNVAKKYAVPRNIIST